MFDKNALKIAYIGGGSRLWARTLMNDLAVEKEIGGLVSLYDIDHEASKQNEIIGNSLNKQNGYEGNFKYKSENEISNALSGADFVIISILPATLDEMESDVHTPEKFGIYQSVGDTVGPSGIVRSLRTVPMIKEIAENIAKFCPNAWVINYTNPMAVCVRTLYKAFPDIKAFGCCHEVFDTEKLLNEIGGGNGDRTNVKINLFGINHFTWITEATENGVDLFKKYKEFVEKNYQTGFSAKSDEGKSEWLKSSNKVKFDLFRRYGLIACAGDRHLAEFCPAKWYLESPESVKEWGFKLTSVSERKKELFERIEETKKLVSGERKLVPQISGEEGVRQIKAILGLGDLVTNVNLPNRTQVDGLPSGVVVETNARFTKDSVKPMFGGSVKKDVLQLLNRVAMEEELAFEAGYTGNYELAFSAFMSDELVNLNFKDARKLFDEMLYNTRKYLPFYDDYIKNKKA